MTILIRIIPTRRSNTTTSATRGGMLVMWGGGGGGRGGVRGGRGGRGRGRMTIRVLMTKGNTIFPRGIIVGDIEKGDGIIIHRLPPRVIDLEASSSSSITSTRTSVRGRTSIWREGMRGGGGMVRGSGVQGTITTTHTQGSLN